jgi:hypothetical protein
MRTGTHFARKRFDWNPIFLPKFKSPAVTRRAFSCSGLPAINMRAANSGSSVGEPSISAKSP